MPLLRRQAFKKQELPENLQPNEELFYCKLTNEVFRDYNTFFERVILCNSLVWTCQLTGRPSLTYLEAIESEERARNSLAAIPVALKRTLLYLARLTKCGRLSDLCDDVFHFVKDRFFVGEEVEAAIDGDRRCCKVVKVLPPQSTGKRKGSTSSLNGNSADILKSDEDEKSGNGNVELDPAQCRYQVCDCEDPDRSLHVLTADDILRKKGVYSREKNRLFLKHTCELRGGQWLLKDKYIEKYNINEMKFSDIYAGSKPNLETLASKRKPSSVSPSNNGGGSKSKSKDGDKKRHDSKSSSKSKGSDKSEKTHSKKKKLSTKEKEALALKEAQQILEDRLKAKEEQKLKIEEERKKKKEERDKEREKLREERRIMAECLREWQKPRDDLECDDLVDLPPPVPIACPIPNECFGDAVMVLEFVHNFSEQLSTKDSFPNGFTLDLLEKALVEKDVQGPLNDLLQMLLRAIFAFQEEEEEVEKEDRKNAWVSHAAVNILEMEHSRIDAVQAASAARTTASWLAYYHGSLRKMTLDAFTLTEVLRLHLLISGSRNMTMDYSPYSDPGLLLRLEDPALLCSLAKQTVFDISPGNKLKVLTALTNQLLAHYSLRDEIEERLEKLRVAKQDLRMMQWAEQRREREEAALRFKKKMEQRAKAASNVDALTQESKDGKNEKSKLSVEKEKKRLEEELRLEEERQATLESKLKQEFLKKEKELLDIVAKHLNRGAMFPLGRDRAYRRFWMFNALPGLFIEDDEKEVGTCLPHPTPYNPNSNPYMSFNNSINMARQRNSGGGQCHNASDKENEANGQICQSQNCGHRNHKLLSDNHPTMNGIIDSGTPKVSGLVNGVKSELVNGEETEVKSTIFGMCNSQGDSCDVHGCRTCIRWGFYPTVGHVESLIASLNPRGFREGCLKEILVAEKRKVVQSVGRCPVSKLNTSLESNNLDMPKEQEVRKSNRLQPTTAVYPDGTSMDDFLELTFRDSILEMEEKIYAGGLGSLKVKDRTAWREAILQHTYDRQSEDLKWGTKEARNGQIAIGSAKLMNGIDHPSVNASAIKVDPPDSATSQTVVIKEMASALLQIYQGIEVKYLIAPLVPDKEGDFPSTNSRHKSYAERWEDSLMSSTSLSQLFVHLATLEKCVAWSRSALNARCRICRRKKDAEHMLLCDGCDRGHHMYCLKPPLKEIPEGEWLCQDCSPKEKAPRKSRKRQMEEELEDEEEEEEEVEEEEESEKEEEDEEPEEEVDGDSDEPYRATRSRRQKQEESDSGSDSEGSCSDDKIVNNDFCEGCEKGGHLICCDHCPLSYHLECIDPPLRRVPRGIWDCPKCCEYKPAAKKSRPTIKLQKYTKLFKEEQKQPQQRRQKRNRSGVPKEEISPRRSSRNAGRGIKYDKHSSLFDEDEWDTGTTTRKRTPRTHQKEISDEEYYGLRKRLTPPSRRGASMDVPLDFKTCDQLLTELVRNEDSWPFMRPVGKKELPMYHEVVKRPMDFGTMRSKLNAMAYQNNKEYVSDVFLIFQNCILYNPVNSIQYQAAYRLGKLFEERVNELKLNMATTEVSHMVNGTHAKRKRWRRLQQAEDDEEKVKKSEGDEESSSINSMEEEVKEDEEGEGEEEEEEEVGEEEEEEEEEEDEEEEEEEEEDEEEEEEEEEDEEEEEEGEIPESGEDEAMETDMPYDEDENSVDSSSMEERSNGPKGVEEEA